MPGYWRLYSYAQIHMFRCIVCVHIYVVGDRDRVRLLVVMLVICLQAGTNTVKFISKFVFFYFGSRVVLASVWVIVVDLHIDRYAIILFLFSFKK